MDLPSRTSEWAGKVTKGSPVTNDLEDRVPRTKIHLSRPPVSKDNRTLCGHVLSYTGVGGDGAHRSVRWNELEERVVGTKTHLSRSPASEDNRTFCGSTTPDTGVGGDGDY